MACKSSPFLPRGKGFSPFFPHKREIGNLWKKCYKVPNLSGECLKTRDFEVQSECPNTATTSTIFKILQRLVFWSFFFVFGSDFEVELVHLQCRRESTVFAFSSVVPMISQQIHRGSKRSVFWSEEHFLEETHVGKPTFDRQFLPIIHSFWNLLLEEVISK